MSGATLSSHCNTAQSGLPVMQRGALIALVALLHAWAAWALLSMAGVVPPQASASVLFVEWVSPPSQQVQAPAPPPNASTVKPQLRQQPAITSAAPTPQATPSTFETAAEPPSATPVTTAVATPTPAAPQANTSAQPKTIPSSAVRYRVPPQLRMPRMSSRLNEQGHVVVRILIDASGKALQAEIAQSSGYERLDREAIRAMMQAEYIPHEEGGQPVTVWALASADFKLE